MRTIFVGVLAAVLAAAAPASNGSERTPTRPPAGGNEESVPGARSIDPPAPPGSTSPALAAEDPTTVSREHEVLMTWLTPGESGGRLSFSRLSGGVWSRPITVADGVANPNAADPPSLTVIDTQAVRRTLIARAGDVVARSGDGGRTWSRLPAPDLSFASFAGGDEGGYVFWLDADAEGSVKLLGSRVLAGKSILDGRAASGAGTSAAMTWDGPVVAYRDEGVANARPISVIRREDAKWTPPRPVHARASDGSGAPQIAALRRRLAVAWYAEAPPLPRVVVAFSSDAGRSFGVPLTVAEGTNDGPIGPAAVALDDEGRALVLWTARRGSTEATLNLARLSPDGARGETVVVAKGPRASFREAPRIVRAGDRVVLSWMDGKHVRARVEPLDGIPAAADPPRSATAAPPGPRAYDGRGRVGETVPRMELARMSGGRVALDSLRGRPALLNFWATWCAPCIQEMPELAALHARHRDAGLAMVAVSVDSADALEEVRAFVSERSLPFDVWLDPDMRLSRALRLRGVPATFVVDGDGRILFRRNRAIEAGDAELGAAIDRALRDR